MKRILRMIAIAALGAAMVAFVPDCRAQAEDAAGEQKIKAAFLFKFGSFIEWPANVFPGPDAPIVIGVLGADDLADELSQVVAGRSVNGRPVQVRKLRRGTIEQPLQILFVSRSEGARAAATILAVKGQPVLVVTDSEAAFEQGAMINFVLVDDKLRFDVAPPSSERGNLRISARLLAVARKIVQGRPS